MIKASYRENFQREITDEEIEVLFMHLMPRMEDELKNLKGFSEAEFERYMSSKNNDLLFSPANIHNELRKVLTTEGEDALADAGKYKRLREMEVATRYCFANFKKTGDMLMVKAQDNPDIILALMGRGSSSKNIPAFRLEVMTVPEIVKGKLNADLPSALVKFIQEKKFSKDYGRDCSLIVNLDFTQMAFDFDKVTAELQKIKNNPYISIWFTFVSSGDTQTMPDMTVAQVYPSFVRQDYNLQKEPNLLY